MKEFTTMSASSMIFVYNHNGYLFKLPVSLGTYEDPEKGDESMWMSFGIGILANALVYAGYTLLKKRKTKAKEREHKISYARYLSNTDRANNYLRDNQIFYQSSLNNETKNNGLIILEAYYGLSDHIYKVEAGLLRFKLPENAQDHANAQILPVTK